MAKKKVIRNEPSAAAASCVSIYATSSGGKRHAAMVAARARPDLFPHIGETRRRRVVGSWVLPA